MRKVPSNEDDLAKQEIYTDAEETQRLRLIDGDSWPGSLKNWIHSRYVRPVAINGLIEDNQTFRENWITGFVSFFNAMGSYLWTTILTQWSQWLTNNNISDASLYVTETSVNVASQATLTLTCAAGHSYKVLYAGLSNSNRAPTPTLVYTPNGGTALTLTQGNGVQTATNVLIGASSQGNGIGGKSVMQPFWIQAGDTIALTDGAFVAADVMTHGFIYEDWDIT